MNEHLQHENSILEEEKSKKLEILKQKRVELVQKKFFDGASQPDESGSAKSIDLYKNKHKDEQRQDLFRVKRLEKLKHIQNCCILLIYRLSCQLSLDNKITNENLVQKFTTVGLRLEHIMASLSKNKQKLYNIESINTDTSNKYPPEFMNIRFFYAQEKEDSEEDLKCKIH